MSQNPEVNAIINRIIAVNIEVPPRTAVSAYYWAVECAGNYRRAACMAADAGERELAIELTTKAQKADDCARSWKPVVPDWQWAIWHSMNPSHQ